MSRTRSRARRLSLAVTTLLLAGGGPGWAQDGAVNTIPTGQGYGAADAGRTGKLPPGPAAGQDGLGMTPTGKPGVGGIAGPGGPATGDAAGSSARSVETGGTEGAGSR